MADPFVKLLKQRATLQDCEAESRACNWCQAEVLTELDRLRPRITFDAHPRRDRLDAGLRVRNRVAVLLDHLACVSSTSYESAEAFERYRVDAVEQVGVFEQRNDLVPDLRSAFIERRLVNRATADQYNVGKRTVTWIAES